MVTAGRFLSPTDQITFFNQVWDLVRQIPPGKVTTYGYIASLLRTPSGMDPKLFLTWRARWVGSAMAACPPDVPWQRVVNAQGKISVRRSGGHSRQRELLENEGIVFDDRGRIDLARYSWQTQSEG